MVLTNKPKIQRTQISITDRDSILPSANRTVYGATPEQVMQRIMAALGGDNKNGSAPASDADERNGASQVRTAGAAGRVKRRTVKA